MPAPDTQNNDKARAPLLTKPRENRRTLAIVMMLIAYMFFAAVDTSAKWLVVAGMPSLQAAFSRYAIQAILVVVLFMPRFGPSVFKSNSYSFEIIRALLLLASTICNFFAVKYLPLTLTAAIMFTLPLITCALSIPLLGETVGWRRWVAILVGFGGILIIVQPGGASFHWAMILSLASVTAYALYNIVNRKLAGVDSTYTQQMYSALIATACLLPFAFTDWVWPDLAASWFAFLMMGVFAMIGHLLLTVAHRWAEASTLAPFVYPHIIYMTFSGWIIFGDLPNAWIFVGAPIVIGSGLYIWARERNLKTPEKLNEAKS